MNHFMHFRNRTGKIFVLLLTLMLAFSTLAYMPEVYAADEPLTEETGQAPEEPQPSEETAPPSEEPQLTAESEPSSEEPPLAAESKPSVMMQAADEPEIITDADGTQYARDEVIVKFKRTASDSVIMSTLDAAGSDVLNTIEAYGLTVAEVPDGETVESFIGDLEAQPNVEYAEPNYVYTLDATVSDPRFSEQWYLNKINIPSAWNITMGLPDIKVAVLDTGIDLSHPEFTGQIYAQADTVKNDGNAQDDSKGYKCYGHGTHVSGIIAGKADNSTGISGVAPGAKLIVVDVYDKDGAFITDIIEGIQFAVANGATVINISMGGYTYSRSYENAINDAVSAGVVCVASAGNDNRSTPHYPSDYTEAISVIATDENDQRASFSNYGSLKDISAPGTNILSTIPGSNYDSWDGTSMASPVVAGVAALIKSANPSLLPADIKNILYSTADDLGAPGKDATFGYGRVNAYSAVLKAQPVDDKFSITVDTEDVSHGNVSGGGLYSYGDSVTVTAVPNTLYSFVRWAEAGSTVSTNASYTFTASKNVSLTAEFKKDDYIISVSANNAAYGSVSGGGTFQYGDSVTLIATPSSNCFFTGWTENGTMVYTNPTYTFTATKSTTIEAVFGVNSFTVSLTPNNEHLGSVSGSGSYSFGSVVTLQASPFPKYRFIRWSENGKEVSRDQNYKITVLKNMCLVAEFAPITPITINQTITNVTYYGGSDGTITVSASGGDSNSYWYEINGTWCDTGFFRGLPAGTYLIRVRSRSDLESIASRTVTVGQPPYMGTVPASKLSTKQNTGSALTIIPPAAPKGYTTQSISFTSSNPSVAVVDASGNVTFLTGGKVTIITKIVSQTVDKKGRVKTKNTTVKKTITVKQPVSDISLNMGDTTIARTQKVKLIPSFTPATASNKKIRWISSNPKVAAVSSAGVVTGKAGGTAIIICSAQDGSGVSASCTVNVTPIYPTGVKMSKAALTVKLGKTASL